MFGEIDDQRQILEGVLIYLRHGVIDEVAGDKER